MKKQDEPNAQEDRAKLGINPEGEIKMTHIDDWIDSPRCADAGEKYAKFVFWYFRYPAWAQSAFEPWMRDHKLFCTYKGQRFRVTGASRMGDVWLAQDFGRQHGYDHRVAVDDCSDWGATP